MPYSAPNSLSAACDLLAKYPEARILAGGTDLLVQLQQRPDPTLMLVDIKAVAETRRIQQTPEHWLIGAACNGAELGAHTTLRQQWPGVVEAMNLIGSTQIQSRASLGGNLCNASPAADAVPALLAANAVCLIAGNNGRRQLPAAELLVAPGRTCLAPGEFVYALQLPVSQPGWGDAYLRMTPRTEMDIAVAGAGVSVQLDESGRIRQARVALGAVAPTAIIAPEAAVQLLGQAADTLQLEAFLSAVQASCQPIDDKRASAAYRRHVAGVLACRAASIAAQRALTSQQRAAQEPA